MRFYNKFVAIATRELLFVQQYRVEFYTERDFYCGLFKSQKCIQPRKYEHYPAIGYTCAIKKTD